MKFMFSTLWVPFSYLKCFLLFTCLILLITFTSAQKNWLAPDGSAYNSVATALEAIPLKERKSGDTVYVSISKQVQKFTFNDKLELLPVSLPALPTFRQKSANATVRTIESVLQEQLRLEDFRSPGDDDVFIWEKAIATMQIRHTPLHVAKNPYSADGRYTFTRTLTVGGNYFKIYGDEVYINNKTGYGLINTATQPDYSYPTEKELGPLKGSCFYFTSLIYNPVIEGIFPVDFRFGFSYLYGHNSPIFRNEEFAFCDVGVFCYQGSQNYQFINCSTPGTGVMFIGAATCFPSGSPYANKDNFYCDGLGVKNENGYGSISCSTYPAFDNWFRESILRPTKGSSVISRTPDYIYPYAPSHEFCLATGRAVYIPMRNTRDIFGPVFKDLDGRSKNQRGFALINAGIGGLIITGQMAFEGIFEGSKDPNPGVFVLGSVQVGKIDVMPGTDGHSLIKWTGRGLSGGYSGFWDYIDWGKPWITGDWFIDQSAKNKSAYLAGSLGIVNNEFILFYVRGKKLTSTNIPPLSGSKLYIGAGVNKTYDLNNIKYTVEPVHNTIKIYLGNIDPSLQDKGIAAILWE